MIVDHHKSRCRERHRLAKKKKKKKKRFWGNFGVIFDTILLKFAENNNVGKIVI